MVITNAGYHTIIHEVPQTTATTIAGYNQLLSGIPGTLVVDGNTTPAYPADGNTQLYSLNSGMDLCQLTGRSVTNAFNSAGYAWMGGMLVQWGFSTIASMGTVNFSATFPKTVLSIQTTLVVNPALPFASSTVVVTDGAVTSSAFGYKFSGTAGVFAGFTWLAIGY